MSLTLGADLRGLFVVAAGRLLRQLSSIDNLCVCAQMAAAPRPSLLGASLLGTANSTRYSPFADLAGEAERKKESGFLAKQFEVPRPVRGQEHTDPYWVQKDVDKWPAMVHLSGLPLAG
jgi:hypothetical protein